MQFLLRRIDRSRLGVQVTLEAFDVTEVVVADLRQQVEVQDVDDVADLGDGQAERDSAACSTMSCRSGRP